MRTPVPEGGDPILVLPPHRTETEKVEQKPQHPGLLLSLKSSCWLLFTLLQGDDYTRSMGSRGLVLPPEQFNHKSVTGR